MRRYRLGSHAKYDLKVHLVWCPKYRKRVLTGQVAIRVRDLLRQIAAEKELQIISGKVGADHVHMFISYRAHQNISHGRRCGCWPMSSRLLFNDCGSGRTFGGRQSIAQSAALTLPYDCGLSARRAIILVG
jgi:REP-associated tyrosine transposase